MADAELLMFFLAAFQGMFFVGLLLLSLFDRALTSFILSQAWDQRKHAKSVSFFECAAYSRLNSQLRYNVQAFSIISAFLIYDADLMFFLSEVLQLDGWTAQSACFFFLFLGIFMGALAYDSQQTGFLWES